jgi:uncharacterized Zn finger protein
MASINCPDCDAEIETTEQVETESIGEIEVEEVESSGPPSVTLGTEKRDLYRCTGCGTVLGVN